VTESKKEIQAKGALLVPLALIINSVKGVDWVVEVNLTAEELLMIRKGIFASKWYDRDLMERMALGVFKVVSKNQPEGAYQFGFGIMAETLLKIYRSSFMAAKPEEMLNKFVMLWNGTWFNSGKVEFSLTGKGSLVKMSDPAGIPCQTAFVPMMRGIVMRLLKENGVQNPGVTITEEPLVNQQKLFTLTLNISWDK